MRSGNTLISCSAANCPGNSKMKTNVRAAIAADAKSAETFRQSGIPVVTP